MPVVIPIPTIAVAIAAVVPAPVTTSIPACLSDLAAALASFTTILTAAVRTPELATALAYFLPYFAILTRVITLG